MFESFSVIFTIAALFNFINYKWLKLPTTIGLMILSLLLIIPITFSKTIFPEFYRFFCDIIVNADFKTLLLDGILSFLLFAGALHVNFGTLAKQKKSIFLFATLGVLISTFLVGGLIFFAAQLFSIDLPFLHALLFGALISPKRSACKKGKSILNNCAAKKIKPTTRNVDIKTPRVANKKMDFFCLQLLGC